MNQNKMQNIKQNSKIFTWIFYKLIHTLKIYGKIQYNISVISVGDIIYSISEFFHWNLGNIYSAYFNLS